MPYICPSCRKTKKLPDFCCGASMIPVGTYYCSTCKNTSTTLSNCCGNSMEKF
ncbi:MAG: hypothetical protein ACOX47_00260 [Bacillota bacterium]